MEILFGLLSCQRAYRFFLFIYFFRCSFVITLLHFFCVLNLICDIELFFFVCFFTMSFSQEGYGALRAVGRGGGVLGSPMFLQFGTPVNGRGIVLGGNEGT